MKDKKLNINDQESNNFIFKDILASKNLNIFNNFIFIFKIIFNNYIIIFYFILFIYFKKMIQILPFKNWAAKILKMKSNFLKKLFLKK